MKNLFYTKKNRVSGTHPGLLRRSRVKRTVRGKVGHPGPIYHRKIFRVEETKGACVLKHTKEGY